MSRWNMNGTEIIKTGKVTYDNSTFYLVRIVKTNFKPGSGDHEDPPEIANDEYGIFFEVQYAPPNENVFRAGGGYFDTVEGAVSEANSKSGGVAWDDE